MSKVYLNRRKVSPGNAKENARLISYALETAKTRDTIIYPDGVIPLVQTIEQSNIALYHEGNVDTQLKIVHTTGPGMLITQQRTIERSHFSGLRLINDMKGDYPNCHGIECSVPATFEDVRIENFLGHGLYLWAWYKNERPGDVSNTYCRTVTIFSCKGDGLRIQGIEANAGEFHQIIVSSNYGYGINDKSALGNRFYSCTAHGNRKGDYKATESSTSANFFGCYSEGTGEDNPTYSHFAGWAQVYGGTWGSRFILDDHATFYGTVTDGTGKIVRQLNSKHNVDKTPKFYYEELKKEEAQ